MKPSRDLLYRFHKELNRPFSGPEDLLEVALALIGRSVRSDVIDAFLFKPRGQELVLKRRLVGGRPAEAEEKIHLAEGGPLWRLVHGRARPLAFSGPRPLLYVPLRWPETGEEGLLGALRLRRREGRRPYSAGERSLAAGLAAELAQNLHQTRLAQERLAQLKRLEALTDLTAVFASSLRVEDGLKLILQEIARHFQLDRVRLYLVDRERRLLRGELSVDLRGRVGGLRSEEIPLAGEHRFARLLAGAELDAHMRRYQDRVVYLPLTVQGQNTGLLVADNLLSQQAIAPEDVSVLRSFAGQIALAVDNARLFEEVQELSLYDGLTGLPVRRFFETRFQEELYRAERSGDPLSLAILDIDFFKAVNDTFGHQVGDQVLQAVGRAVSGCLRKIDFPARFGGDELMILLPQVGVEAAEAILRRVLEAVREVRVPVPFSSAGEVRVTASIGAAAYPLDGRNARDLVARADEALYRVKSRGRDAVEVYRKLDQAEAKG